MAGRIGFELVSPEKLLLSEDVEMVVVPGGEGNFGVLPGHALFISTVRAGVIDVYEGNRVSERIFVSGGFAEVTPERCTVLADEAMPLSSLDRTQIEESLRSAEAEIASLTERLARLQGAERDQATIELAAAEARRDVAQAKRAAIEAGAGH
ncbi:MAG TPA: ATP synthase F1 subunit epsilon [Stellaceae bacterium]|jgi:F-type H+-transporting ATPase subunit epsilon|nr:ATP synthase F1 subunit epsilon [Stellaceae bacterium]